MRILALADYELPECKDLPPGPFDVVVGCGDLQDSVLLQARALYGVPVVAVKGNHDSNAPFPAGVQDVHLAFQQVGGVGFGGHQGAWRYKPVGHFLYDASEVSGVLDFFPRVDIFVAHNPPAGVHDRDDGVHNGFPGFRSYILKHKPGIFLHGHTHVDRETRLGVTRVIGVFGWKIVDVEAG